MLVPEALIGVRPRGKVSLTVTTPFVAPRRLTFETVIGKTRGRTAGEIAYVGFANRQGPESTVPMTAFR